MNAIDAHPLNARNKANYIAANAAYNARELERCLAFYAQGHQIMSRPTPPGREQIRAFLEGTLAGVEGDALLVDASSVRQVRGYISDLGGVRVTLPRKYVTRMDERRLSRSRTLMVVGGVVAIVVGFFAVKVSGKSTPADEDPGGGPDQ